MRYGIRQHDAIDEPPLNPPEPEVATFVCEGCGESEYHYTGTGEPMEIDADGDVTAWCDWGCYRDTDGPEVAPDLREGLVKHLADQQP